MEYGSSGPTRQDFAEPVGNPPNAQHDDVAAPPGAIDEAPFQGGRGLCGRSERTAPDLDRNSYPTGSASHRCPDNPALTFITASSEPLVGVLTGGACPFRERAWQVVASLIHQTASGVVQ